MGNIGFGGGKEYQAIFSTASMLQKGDDVRIAGVNVGEVREVEHHDRTQALVTFRIKDEIELTTASRAEIRFLNLVGDRYLGLEQGTASDAEPLEPDDVIPVDRTSPALDLTVLFNGFQPLFQALNPTQVNELSLNLVQVLQGEGGTVAGLVAQDRLAHQRPGRPGRADRRRDHQPQPDAPDRRQPPRGAQRPDHRAEGVDGRPRPGPGDDRLLARQHLRPHRRGRRPPAAGPAPGEVGRREAPSSSPACSTSRRAARRWPRRSSACRSR